MIPFACATMLATACGGASSRLVTRPSHAHANPRAHAVPTRPTPEPAAAGEAPSPRPLLPPALAIPTHAVCVVEGRDIHPTRLRLAPGRPSFARVTSATAARLHLDPESATLEVVSPPLRLAGDVAPRDVVLAPNAPLAIAGFLVPLAGAPLHLIEARADALVVEIDVPAPVLAGSSAPPRARTAEACGAFRLGPGELDPDVLLGAPLDQAAVAAGREVPIALDAHAPPFGALLFPDDDSVTRLVDVLERGKERTRIAWRRVGPAEVAVTGWVPTKALERYAPQNVLADGATLEPDPEPPPVTHALTCPHELSVVVDLAGERRTVGSVEAGGAVEAIGEDETGWVTVHVVAPGVVLASGARLLARAADLADCRVAADDVSR